CRTIYSVSSPLLVRFCRCLFAVRLFPLRHSSRRFHYRRFIASFSERDIRSWEPAAINVATALCRRVSVAPAPRQSGAATTLLASARYLWDGCIRNGEVNESAIHLIFAIPIVGYIYSPFAELPDYASVVRYIAFPVILLSGFWMYAGVFFAVIGVAVWVATCQLFGVGAAMLIQVVLLI